MDRKGVWKHNKGCHQRLMYNKIKTARDFHKKVKK